MSEEVKLQIEEQKERNKKNETYINNLELRIKDLQGLLIDARAMLTEVNNQKEQLEKDNSNLQVKLKSDSTRVSHVEDKSKQFQEQYNTIKSKYDQELLARQNMESELSDSKTTIQKMKSQLDKLQEETRQLNTKIRTIQSQQTAAKAVGPTSSGQQELKKQLEEEITLKTQLETKVHELERKIEENELSLNKLTKYKQRLDREYSKSKEQAKQYQEEKFQLEDQNFTLTSEQEVLNNKITQMQRSIDQLKQALDTQSAAMQKIGNTAPLKIDARANDGTTARPKNPPGQLAKIDPATIKIVTPKGYAPPRPERVPKEDIKPPEGKQMGVATPAAKLGLSGTKPKNSMKVVL